MTNITPNPLSGVAWIACGALLGATCYAPQARVRGWSWQSFWLAQAIVAWVILPVVGAWATIPELGAVLREAPKAPMISAFALGAAYGIGGTAFGLAIRYVGFSLTYSIAIGISCVLGTLVPPLLRGTLGATLQQAGAGWIIAGLVLGVAGITLAGMAGRRKERDLAAAGSSAGRVFTLGLSLAIASGVLAAFYGFALAAGEPLATAAAARGAGVVRGNIVYLFANTGAFVTSGGYALALHLRHRSLRELVCRPAGGGSLPANWALSATTGLFWYGQFFLYTLGDVRMGAYRFTSWGIHMILTVLFSNAVAVAFGEWRNCSRTARRWIALAMIALVASILSITNGNRLAQRAAQPAAAAPERAEFSGGQTPAGA
ncbi:MAG: rhamnose:proton symporter [Kiritimatiellae bacterium]|nr:rhamnose:proton symporter [Kiritimatiellia bacterium]